LQVINEGKQLQSENTNLISQNARKDISIAESKAVITTKSRKIRLLESMIKILEGKLTSAKKDVFSIQNDSLKKESEILSLKSKMAEVEQMKNELALKVSELEHLKSEDISRSVVGGIDEKNISSSNNISTVSEPSKNLSQYLACRKNMEDAKKIDTIILDHTNDKIIELPKVNTENILKVSDETNISETSKDIMLDTSIKPDISKNITHTLHNGKIAKGSHTVAISSL